MRRLELTTAGGGVAALAALVASSCCALPMALVFAGVSTNVVGLLGPVRAYRGVLQALAAVLLATAWVMAFRHPSRRLWVVLALATIGLAASFLWPLWDPALQGLVMRTFRS